MTQYEANSEYKDRRHRKYRARYTMSLENKAEAVHQPRHVHSEYYEHNTQYLKCRHTKDLLFIVGF